MQARPIVFNPFINNSNSDSDDDIFGSDIDDVNEEQMTKGAMMISLLALQSPDPIARALGGKLMETILDRQIEKLALALFEKELFSKVSNNPSAMFGANNCKKQGAVANDVIKEKDISDKEMANSAFGQGSNYARSMKR